MEAQLKTEKRKSLQKTVYKKLKAEGVYTHTDPAFETSRKSEERQNQADLAEGQLWLPGDPPIGRGTNDPWADPGSLTDVRTGSQELSSDRQPGGPASSTTAQSAKQAVLFRLKNDRGEILYRRDSFRRLLDNDSAKYHENGQKEVFEEF